MRDGANGRGREEGAKTRGETPGGGRETTREPDVETVANANRGARGKAARKQTKKRRAAEGGRAGGMASRKGQAQSKGRARPQQGSEKTAAPTDGGTNGRERGRNADEEYTATASPQPIRTERQSPNTETQTEEAPQKE